MKIAYLVLAHHQPALLQRLIGALHAQGSHFFVHIDLRVPTGGFAGQCDPRTTTFVEDRIRVNHGGFTQVRAMLKLLELASSVSDFDYFVFLSGQDYPIKNNNYIQKYFTQHCGTNFINFYPLIAGADLSQNIRRYYFTDALSALPSSIRKPIKAVLSLVNAVLPDRPFFDSMIPYRGSTSWCLTGETAKTILDFAKSNQDYLTYFRRAFCSDEIFFQTIVLNSTCAPSCRFYERDVLAPREFMKNENKAYLHYIDWSADRDNP